MKRAFTMIEVMISMAILMILTGLTFYVGSSVVRGAKERQTMIAVETAHSLMGELEMRLTRLETRYVAGPTGTIAIVTPAQWYANGTLATHSTERGAFWRSWFYPYTAVAVPDFVDSESLPMTDDALRNTVLAWREIRNVPANKAAMDKLPASSVSAITIEPGTPREVTSTVLLDAWHRPLLLIPGEGYAGNVDGIARTVAGSNHRPFFLSAGADGLYETISDNITQ